MHTVKKKSTTAKLRLVFDAFAKSSTGISLNDFLLVWPTVHTTLIDVLLLFRFHQVALIADVRCIEVSNSLPKTGPTQINLEREFFRILHPTS